MTRNASLRQETFTKGWSIKQTQSWMFPRNLATKGPRSLTDMSSLLHVPRTSYIIKHIFSKYSVCVCICCYMTSSKICHLYSSLSLIWTRILRFDLNWSSKFVHYIPGMAVFKQSCQTVRQKERLWALTLLALELCRFLHQTHTHTHCKTRCCMLCAIKCSFPRIKLLDPLPCLPCM